MNDFIKDIFSFGLETSDSGGELNISYGVDSNFMFGAAISIMSVLEHNKDIKIIFHLFTDFVDADFLEKSKEMAEVNNTKISIYLIDPEYFSSLPTSQIWSYATYFRLLSFDYLSKSINTVLYLDADVVCKGSLKDIYNIEFQDECAAVIPDVDTMQEKSAERLSWPEVRGKYFNAGVIYVNLAKWISNDFTNKSLKLLKGESRYGLLKYLDQDALNIIFTMNNIYLSRDFNCVYTIKNELKTRNRYLYKNIISESTKLIHYTGATKPWHEWARYPSASYFQNSWKASPWKAVPLKEAKKLVEFKKKYKHEFIQGKYIRSLASSIKYTFLKFRAGKK